MRRLSFLVNRGENDCFMIHGLDWATYIEGRDWSEITKRVWDHVEKTFSSEERPTVLHFRFPDGAVVSLVA